MRTLLIAGTAAVALFGADAASAGERVVQRGPGVRGVQAMPRPAPWVGQQHRSPRWGSKVGGRWWGGVNAPGGWNGYRRPTRGWAVPVYWNTPRFYVSDWSAYGLAQPQSGYRWVRYYDDAVLVDGRGSVYDSVGGVDWDRNDRGGDGDGFDYDDDRVYASNDRQVPPPPAPRYREDYREEYRDERRDDRRDSGLGGAAIGAVAGGVAGNVIAGRGGKLGGTLIGAGAGAAAGYAIDKAEDRGRRAPPPPRRGYRTDYAPPPPPVYAAPSRPYSSAPAHGGGHWVSPDGGTTVVTSDGGYGGGFTTVTVHSAPVITTTTTEIYEDNVTWSRPARKRVWKPRRKVVCRCG